jgi:hypothetical protein
MSTIVDTEGKAREVTSVFVRAPGSAANWLLAGFFFCWAGYSRPSLHFTFDGALEESTNAFTSKTNGCPTPHNSAIWRAEYPGISRSASTVAQLCVEQGNR